MAYNTTVFMNFEGEILHTLDAPYGDELKEAVNLALEKADELRCFFYMVHLTKGQKGEAMTIHKLTKGSNAATQVDNYLLDTPSYKRMREAIQTIRLLKG